MSNDGWGKMPTSDDWSKPKDEAVKPVAMFDGWPRTQPTTSNTDYDDVVTQEDIEHVEQHAKAKYGEPAFTRSSDEGWPKPDAFDAWTQVVHEQWPAPVGEEWVKHPITKEPSGYTMPSFSDGWGSAGSWPAEKAEIDKFVGGGQWTTSEATAATAKYEEREKQWTHNALDSANTRASVINSLNGRKDEYTIDQDGELNNIKETVPAKKPGEPTGWYLAYSNGKWLHAILSGPYTTTQEALLRSETVWNKFTNDGAFQLAFDNKFNRDGVYCAEIPLSLKRHGAYGVLT